MFTSDQWMSALEPRRLLSAGDLDPTFGKSGIAKQVFAGDVISAQTTVQPDHKIVVSMFLSNGNTNEHLVLARFTSAGKLDNSFGSGGEVVVAAARDGEQYSHPIIDGKGRVLVWVGASLYRFTAQGKFDAKPSNAGVVSYAFGQPILPDGKTFRFDGAFVERFLTSGKLDTSFGNKGKVFIPFTTPDSFGNPLPLEPGEIQVQPDGEIIVTVSGGDAAFNVDSGIVGITSAGKIDTSFGDLGIALFPDEIFVNELALPDGKIAAMTFSDGGNRFFSILDADGQPDATQPGGLSYSNIDLDTGEIVTAPGNQIDIEETDDHGNLALTNISSSSDIGVGQSVSNPVPGGMLYQESPLPGDQAIFTYITAPKHGQAELVLVKVNTDAAPSLSASGVLTIRGTPKDDGITVFPSNGGLDVDIDGADAFFVPSSVKSILIDAEAGSDSVRIDPTIQVPVSINGGVGDDTLMPGDGPETLVGGAGADMADFSAFNANLTITLDNKPNDGPAGADMNVESDIENIIGGSGNDLIIGGPFAEHLYGGPGNDTLWGGGGNDTLEGGHGHDQLFGQGGDDLLIARDNTQDTLDGGDGIDRASIDDSLAVKDHVTKVEQLV
jgi:uncharacterized delta-60 repeat protein